MKKHSKLIILILIAAFTIYGALNYLGVFSFESISAAQKVFTRTNLPVRYNDQKMGKWLKILKDRPKLSTSDETAKTKIISPLARVKNKSGYLEITKDYKIEYVSNANEFFVEITGVNTQQAKYNAIQWFKAQGISDDALCKLPVVFYLNWDVGQQIRNLNIQFNPLPDNCN